MNRTLLCTIMVFCLATAEMASACPSCRDAVEAQSTGGSDIAMGFALSIALMLSMPLAIVTTGVVALWRAQRSRRSIEADENRR